MGFGMMQCWINGPATGGIDDKIKMVNILLIRLRRTIIPSFHYSISGENSEAQKISIFSVGCRNSETLNYTVLGTATAPKGGRGGCMNGVYNGRWNWERGKGLKAQS